MPLGKGSLLSENAADNTFSTIQCPSGTSPVADSSTDTLTFTSSDGSVTITGNSSTDTIDFVAGASASNVISKGSSDATTTTTTLGDVTGLGFSIGANEEWSFEFILQVGCDGTGGMRFAITVPTGATFRAVANGNGAGATSITSHVMEASGTQTGIVFCASAISNGWARISGTVNNGSTAGTLQLQFKSQTDTQTSTIFAESYVLARKVA